MPSVSNPGGHISENSDPKNYAAVTTAEATKAKTGATWVVTLKDLPTKANFKVGEALTYNSKSTNNPNANNVLVVTAVNGPTKYGCSGPWPMKI